MHLSNENVRRGNRVPCTMRAPLAPDPASPDLIEDASTIDLSESGLRLRLHGEIVPGQIVDVFLSKHPEPCRVVWTSPGTTGKELIAGLEFIYPLPDPRRRQTPASSKFEPIN